MIFLKYKLMLEVLLIELRIIFSSIIKNNEVNDFRYILVVWKKNLL